MLGKKKYDMDEARHRCYSSDCGLGFCCGLNSVSNTSRFYCEGVKFLVPSLKRSMSCLGLIQMEFLRMDWSTVGVGLPSTYKSFC